MTHDEFVALKEMPPVRILRSVQRRHAWRVGQRGVRAIELVTRPSARWGLTTASSVWYRARFNCGISLRIS